MQTAGLGKLVQLVGPSAAKRIMFLADRFGADEALSMGLINQVVPKASLEEHTAVWTKSHFFECTTHCCCCKSFD